MLQHISWQLYLTAVTMITLAWYLVILTRYYRPEIKKVLRITPSSQPAPEVSHPEIMGKARQEEFSSADGENGILFSDQSIPDDISDHTALPGPTDGLLDEAQTLIRAFQDSDDKDGFLSLLHTLLDKYELHREEIDLKAVAKDLQDKAETILPFPLTKKEWSLSWPEQ